MNNGIESNSVHVFVSNLIFIKLTNGSYSYNVVQYKDVYAHAHRWTYPVPRSKNFDL